MSSPERNHKVLRIVTAGSIAALGVAGAAIGKTVIEELSKPKVSALEKQQPEGIAPSQKAFQDLVTVTPSPSPSPEPSATVEALKSPTPEAKPTPCTIVSPELCAQAERIERPNAEGDIVTYIGLRLPPGTKIFSPIDGQVAKVKIPEGASLKGFTASIDDLKPASTAFYITGDLIFPNYLSLNEKQGTQIAEVGDQGIQNLGDYNVVITAGRFDTTKGSAVTALDILESSYPNAFKQPAKRVEAGSTKQYFAGNVYLGGNK